MARKKKPEEHANHERWLVSYADFITLLFAFFTTLYAISTVDAKKAGKLVYSLRAVFDLDFFPSNQPTLGGSGYDTSSLVDPVSPHMKVIKLVGIPPPQKPMMNARKVHALTGALAKLLAGQTGDAGKHVHLSHEPRGLVISLDAERFFASGSAEVQPSARLALDDLGKILAQTSLPLRVEGHTDNQPVRGRKFRSNWELSTARSVTIVTRLIDNFAYPPDMLSAAGYGDTRPVQTNNTAHGRSRNRRVDLVVLREIYTPPVVDVETE
jgi:chemotaxis protein MotB